MTDLTLARLPPVGLEKLIQMHEKDARTHERHGRLGDAAFHSETADRLSSLAAKVIELEAQNARLMALLRKIVAASNSDNSAHLHGQIAKARTALETPNAD